MASMALSSDCCWTRPHGGLRARWGEGALGGLSLYAHDPRQGMPVPPPPGEVAEGQETWGSGL